jgi:hypothetical protein
MSLAFPPAGLTRRSKPEAPCLDCLSASTSMLLTASAEGTVSTASGTLSVRAVDRSRPSERCGGLPLEFGVEAPL